MRFRPHVAALAALFAAAPVRAAPIDHPLERLPADKLVQMPALLRHGDIALIESFPDGRMRQVTLLLLVAAPSALVHDIVADVAKYPEFIHNMSKSTMTRNPDGSVDQQWVIDYTIASFDNVNRNYFRSDGAIEVDTLPNHDARYRWEFHPVPGGTVLVMYGYVQISRGNSLLQSIMKRAPTMEHGLALSAQLVLARSVKLRSEALAGPQPPLGDGKARSPGFNFLLDRGRVAVIRSTPAGRLSDISLLDRIAAPAQKVADVILHPDAYASFIEDVKESHENGRDERGLRYQTEVEIPLCSWDTRYLMVRDAQGGIDSYGVDGDLKGSRYRWDLSPVGAAATLAVLRATQNLAATSLVLRALFQKEPLFEHGINVALGLVTLSGIKRQAEKK